MELFKEAVAQLIQILGLEIGIFFLGNGLTAPPAQGSLSPDPDCTAAFSYYQTIATLQVYQVFTMILAAWLLCGMKLYLEATSSLVFFLSRWKKTALRFVLILAILASVVSSVLTAAIYYNVMLVKVGLDKGNCLPGSTKPLIIAMFIVLGAVGVAVHGVVAAVAFKD